MTLNRLITSLVQLALLAITVPMLIAAYKDLKELFREEM